MQSPGGFPHRAPEAFNAKPDDVTVIITLDDAC
jgi:hypothetical protein